MKVIDNFFQHQKELMKILILTAIIDFKIHETYKNLCWFIKEIECIKQNYEIKWKFINRKENRRNNEKNLKMWDSYKKIGPEHLATIFEIERIEKLLEIISNKEMIIINPNSYNATLHYLIWWPNENYDWKMLEN